MHARIGIKDIPCNKTDFQKSKENKQTNCERKNDKPYFLESKLN